MPLPPPNDIPLAAPDIEKLQWALDTVRRHEGWIRSLRVTGAAFQNNVFGASISIPPPIKPRAGRREFDEWKVARVTGAETGGATYLGRRVFGNIGIDPSTDFDLPGTLTIPAADDCILVNMDEYGQSTHWIQDGSYAVVRDTGETALPTGGGDYLPVYEIIRGVYKSAFPLEANDADTTTLTPNATTFNRGIDEDGVRIWRQRIARDDANKKLVAIEWSEDYAADGRLVTKSDETARDLLTFCEPA